MNRSKGNPSAPSGSPRICLLQGDGISAELLSIARAAIEQAIPRATFDEVPFGFEHFDNTGEALPMATLEIARAADACFLVAVGSPLVAAPGYRSPIVALRREFDLFANIRPVQNLPGQTPVDLIVVRENTEGLYSGQEQSEPGRATATRIITESASRRITRVAAELAMQRDRRVTVVHKANVLRETCGLFRRAAFDELANFPEVAVSELLVDNAALQAAANPAQFDVIVTTNLFGDILSDVASHAGGGLGLATSSNIGPRHALFEPVHGSAPDLIGTAKANPIATLRAAAALIDYLGFADAAASLIRSISTSLKSGSCTPDLGGTSTTQEVAQMVLN